jgi:outer membrane protein assembly factor BamB
VKTSDLVFVGVGSNVVAINKLDGATVWETCVRTGWSGRDFVTVLVDGDCVYAHGGGELHCLEAATGIVRWKNDLPGRGYGLATLAVEGNSSGVPPLIQQKSDDDATASASANNTSS